MEVVPCLLVSVGCLLYSYHCMQVVRNSEVSHQTSFLAVYNTETTEILAFYQVILLLVTQNAMLFRLFESYISCIALIFLLQDI